MPSFSAKWLALREPVDEAARAQTLVQKLAEALPPQEPLDVLDLGTGTGANVRYLMDRLPGSQRWLLVDNDEDLLKQVPEQMTAWATARHYEVFSGASGMSIKATKGTRLIETRQQSLRLLDATTFKGRALVTVSALLDLVSDDWLRTFIPRCREANAAVLFALNYDGRMRCEPMEAEDFTIRDLVNRHQKTDKGFGNALGPDAVRVVEDYLRRLGYVVKREASDWRVPPGMGELQRQIIDGWAEAALATAPAQADMIQGWRERRVQHVENGNSRLIVGHLDLAGWLKPTV